MGTRSLTIVKDGDDECCVLYRQYDGYPTGHGVELKEFLQDFQLTNGLGLDQADQKTANGMGCLAAQVIAHFKQEAGGFYLYPSGTRDCGEEYIYIVYEDQGQLRLMLRGGAVTFFGLPGTKEDNMPIIYDGEVAFFDAEEAEKHWMNQRETVVNDFVESQKSKA